MLIDANTRAFWKGALQGEGAGGQLLPLLTKNYVSYVGLDSFYPPLAPDGDLDGDRLSNRCEYDYVQLDEDLDEDIEPFAHFARFATDAAKPAADQQLVEPEFCGPPMPGGDGSGAQVFVVTLTGTYAGSGKVSGSGVLAATGRGTQYLVEGGSMVSLSAEARVPGVGHVFAGWFVEGESGYRYENPAALIVSRNLDIAVNYSDKVEITLSVIGNGTLTYPDPDNLSATRTLREGTSTPVATYPAGSFHFQAAPDAGNALLQWEGHESIHGKTALTVDTPLAGKATVTAHFVPCGETAVPIIEDDFSTSCIGCPPAGWSQVPGFNGIIVGNDTTESYITTAAGADPNAIMDMATTHADTDTTFRYRFTDAATADTGLLVMPRHITFDNRLGARITQGGVTLINRHGGDSHDVSASRYFQRGVWYEVLLRTSGGSAAVWVLKEGHPYPSEA